ncbi:MAG: hypothetical protein B7Y25_08205, partial [Alphaproteobacteria bacterium 16-39-46]
TFLISQSCHNKSFHIKLIWALYINYKKTPEKSDKLLKIFTYFPILTKHNVYIIGNLGLHFLAEQALDQIDKKTTRLRLRPMKMW